MCLCVCIHKLHLHTSVTLLSIPPPRFVLSFVSSARPMGISTVLQTRAKRRQVARSRLSPRPAETDNGHVYKQARTIFFSAIDNCTLPSVHPVITPHPPRWHTRYSLSRARSLRRLLLPFLQALRALHPPDAAELSKVLLDSFPDEWQERPALQPFLSFYSTLR